MNYLFEVTKNGQLVQRLQTRSKRRFYNRIRTINWQDRPLRVYLRVNYGMAIGNKGKMENFYNDGYYETEEDFLTTLAAFTEADLVNELKSKTNKSEA